MTSQAFCDLIRSVTFRPGWTIEAAAWGDPSSGPYAKTSWPVVVVTITAQLPDAARPEHIVPISLKRTLTLEDVARCDEDFAVFWIWHLLREMTAHEDEEWFKVAGVRRFDPHAPPTRRAP